MWEATYIAHVPCATKRFAQCTKRRSCIGHNSNIGAPFCTEYLVSVTTFLREGESTQQKSKCMMRLSAFPAYLTVGADYRHLLEQFVFDV